MKPWKKWKKCEYLHFRSMEKVCVSRKLKRVSQQSRFFLFFSKSVLGTLWGDKETKVKFIFESKDYYLIIYLRGETSLA